MISWSGFPFVRFTLAFISGILCYLFINITANYLLLAAIGGSCYFLLFLWQKLRRNDFYLLKPLLGFAALFTLFFMGALFTQFQDEQYNKKHLLNTPAFKFYQAVVTSVPEERAKTFKVEAEVLSAFVDNKWKTTEGYVIIYVSKKNYASLKYGDKLFIKGMPERVQPPFNPGEFNYSTYLKYHHIYHTQFLDGRNYKLISSNQGNGFISFAYWLRSQAQKIIEENVPDKTAQGITSALLLGLKGTMEPSVKEIYSNTGTTHVLAVSGMHVAIIFQILVMALFFLKSAKAKRYIFPILLLIALWLYVIITGFCPSVLRAGVTVSLLLIGNLLQKNGNSYNSLFASAFILLCFDPFMIMDTGFQLSYLAVLGIVMFTDKIYSLWEMNNRLTDFIWKTTAMSLAAQITTLPLTIYYFHQFPLSFLLSNLIAIPLSNGLLLLGTFMVSFHFIPFVPKITGLLITCLISILNFLLSCIASIPFSSLKSLQLNTYQMIMLFILIGLLTLFFQTKKLSFLKTTCIVVLIMTSISVYQIIETKNQKSFVVFNLKKETALAFIQGEQAVIFTDSLSQESDTYKAIVQPYMQAKGVTSIVINKSQNWIQNSSTSDFSLITCNSKSFIWLKNKRIPDRLPSSDFVIGKSFVPAAVKESNVILLRNPKRHERYKDDFIYDLNIKPAFEMEL